VNKYKLLWLMSFLFAMAGCNSVKDTKDNIVVSDSMASGEEPCWIKNPSCEATSDEYIYFSGQSDREYSGVGMPEQKGFRSAEEDARKQYAEYLGVRITTDSKSKDERKNDDTSTEFVREAKLSTDQIVSQLEKVDNYYYATTTNRKGERNWRVFMLMRVPRAVAKNQSENKPPETDVSGNSAAETKKTVRKVSGFKFKLNQCERFDDGVYCEFVATSLKSAPVNQWFDNRYCACITHDGDEYMANHVAVGAKEHYNGLKHTYLPDTPVKVKFRCPNVGTNVSSFHSVKFSFLRFPDVVFKNVGIVE